MTAAETERSARARVEGGERVLSLSEAADLLGMKRPNTGKFLARRGVRPAFPKAQGYFYWQADIERIKAERDADWVKVEADERRRRSAIHGRPEDREPPPPPELARLGRAQREVLSELVRHPVARPRDARRFALRRLVQRELVEELGPDGVFILTERGRSLAGYL